MLINDKHILLINDLIRSRRKNTYIYLPNNIKVIKEYNKLSLVNEMNQVDSDEIELIDFALLPNGKHLKIVDSIGAGDFCDKTIGENEAIVIATGSPVPEGADAVLMKEYTTTQGDELTIYSQVTPGENVSPKAEDISKGDVVLSKNTFIRYQEMGLIASAGYNTVKVFKKPKVKVIITGNELVEPTKEEISKAKIINSNQYTIGSMLEDCGVIFDICHVKDSFEEVKEAILESLEEYDVIMTTGGTAISKGDVVLDVVGDIGEILFHGVSIRPGKPIGAGIANDKMIFTFSGQPVAAMSQFDIFARKYLFNMQGRDFNFHIVQRESLLKIPSQLGRTDFIRAFSDDDFARHVLNRGSGIIRSMVEANSYIRKFGNCLFSFSFSYLFHRYS